MWLALRDPSEEELTEVAERFDLPPLAVEDAHESHQRPKIEDYDDDWFVVLKAATYDHARETVEFDEIQMFAGPSFAVVIRGGATNHLEGARKRLDDRPHLLAEGPIAVVWAVLDTVVDDYEPSSTDWRATSRTWRGRSSRRGATRPSASTSCAASSAASSAPCTRCSTRCRSSGATRTKPETTSPMRQYFRDVGDHLQRLERS